MFKDKTVFVTGAGGSIGSALCRKIAADNPKMLILYELNEYALYQIDRELKCNKMAVLGNATDLERTREFMSGVDYVFHTAAYKHVPMCEGINADYAFKNNWLGTVNVLNAAKHVKSVVLLSTDKAIKPICNMGLSKQAAENSTLNHNRVVVRLGNILESSGSVIPLFREQIAHGGPVTVTHPDVTRYFIKMSDAVDFILGAADNSPGIYMVDMGQPQKINDIALQMIGDKNIQIEYTGLRSGEKLHEDIA